MTAMKVSDIFPGNPHILSENGKQKESIRVGVENVNMHKKTEKISIRNGCSTKYSQVIHSYEHVKLL